MLDIGWTELLVIGIVALIVVGPKDLPGMFRALGRFTAKARNMAREFQRAMNDAADQSGMREAADGLKAAANPKKMGMDGLNRAADAFEKWDPTKSLNSSAGKAATRKAGSTDTKPTEGSSTAELRAQRVAEANRIQEETARRIAERREADRASAAPTPATQADAPAEPAPKRTKQMPRKAAQAKRMPLRKGPARPLPRGRR